MNIIVLLVVLSLTSLQSSIEHEYLNIQDCWVSYGEINTAVECFLPNLNIKSLQNLVGFNATHTYSFITISKKQLTNLSEPIFVNYTIKQLDLEQNQIVFITNETLRYIYGLQVIYLDNNFIGEDSFRSLHFSPMANGSIQLKINANQIGQLNETLSVSFSNTTELYLRSNKINHLCDSVFENLKNLKILDLSSNALVELTTRVFSNLRWLFYLNLNSNNLKFIEPLTFAYTPGLLYLMINQNELKNLDANIFGINDGKLAYLQLKYNKFNEVPKAVMKNAQSLMLLELNGNRMSLFDFGSVLMMPNLNYLNLDMCKIDRVKFGDHKSNYSFSRVNKLALTYSNVNEFDFSFVIDYLSSLKELSLSYNQLNSIIYSRMWKLHKNLITLSLDNNLINELTSNNLQPFYCLEYLYLQQNMIKSLPNKAFKGLISLTYLDLSRNQILSVANDALNDLNNLNTLNMSYNRLRIITSGSLYGLLSLNVLDLSWNKLESVKQTDFQPLRSLKKLYLSNNFIIFIEPYSFAKLDDLKTIWLDSNYLSTIENNAFAAISLDYLSLYSNYIKQVEVSSFAGSSILKLDLGSNYLVSFEFLANIADFVRVVSLTDNEYTSFMVKRFPQDSFNSNVEKFDLSWNKISEFRFESDQFHSIQSVDLSWNLIESIRIDDFRSLVNLKDLNLSNNRLKYIEEGFFIFFKFRSLILNDSFSEISFEKIQFGSNLTEIDLSFNRIETFIINDGNHTSNTFNGNLLDFLRLEHVNFKLNDILSNFENYTKLTTLDLSFNNLTFDLNRLNALSNLKGLYLKSTGLQSLEQVYFNLMLLEQLNLARNNIPAVPIDFFQFLNNLVVIDFSYNQIEFIDETLLDFLSHLSELNLAHNRIGGLFILPFTKYSLVINLSWNNIRQIIRPADMDDLKNLKLLDLSQNRLSTVDFDSFFDSGSCKLSALLLNDNQIDSLPGHTFNEMVQLRQLILHNNLLHALDEVTFSYLITLEWLDLSRNQLILNENFSLFNNLVRLKHLNLSCNQIEYVNQRLFAHLFNLNELDLSSNKLKGIQPYSLSSLGQLTYLDVSNNSDLTLYENSLFGLDSIKDVWISFDQLSDKPVNQLHLPKSFKLTSPRHVGEVTYYRSVYVNYRESNMDCSLVLKFIKQSIQLKLRSEVDFFLFINDCYFFNFS